jgi:hypothetical protein
MAKSGAAPVDFFCVTIMLNIKHPGPAAGQFSIRRVLPPNRVNPAERDW